MHPDRRPRGPGQRVLFGLLTLVVPAVVLYETLRQCCAPAEIDPVVLISGITVVLAYWAAGALILWRRFEQNATRRMFLLSQALACALLPLARSWPPPDDLVSALSMLGFHMAAPLLLHYAITFPVSLGSARRRRSASLYIGMSRWMMGLVYGLALLSAAGGLAGIALGSLVVAPFVYTWVVFASAISVLCYAYLARAAGRERRRLRFFMLGSALAVIPPNLLFFIPRLSGASWWLPEWITAAFLLLAPGSFVYAFAQRGLYSADRFLNRALVYVLLSLGILALYVGPFLLVYPYLPADGATQMVIAAGLTLLVGLGFDRTRAHLQRWVDRLFYGGWYDYPAVVETVSDALARSLARAQLEDVLTRQVPKMMQLHPGELWIGDPGARGAGLPPDQPVDRVCYPTSAPQRQFPLSFEGQVRGLWTVGARLDGDDFTPTDRRILQTLAHQAEIALSNVLLVEALQRQVDQIRGMQHRLLRSREEEQARLARDLHDGPVQLLVGLNMQLGLLLSSGDGTPLSEELRAIRNEVRRLLSDLRQVCAELRPPMLDTLGLGAALRALAEEWRAQHGQTVDLDLPPDAALRSLPGEVALNLYRVAQEALTNAARHATAERVGLWLRWDDGRLELVIEDDGHGFALPEALHTLTAEGHFGMVGMQERVNLIGGELAIESAPGQGTTVRALWQPNT